MQDCTRQDVIHILKSMTKNGVLQLTPFLAHEISEKCSNESNRALRKMHIESLAKNIKAGKWKFTHQGLGFSKSGLLLDGHHRCRAVAVSGTTVPIMATFDLDEDAFEAIDHDLAVRSIRDVMQIQHKLNGGSGPMDGRTVDPLNYLVRLCNTDRSRPSLHETQRLYEVFRKEIEDILAACGDNRKGRTAAPIKAALILRLYGATQEERAYLLKQWRAFVQIEALDFDATTNALNKRADSFERTGAVAKQNNRAAIAWIAWNPQHRTLNKIQVNNIDKCLEAMRSVVETAIDESGVADNVAVAPQASKVTFPKPGQRSLSRFRTQPEAVSGTNDRLAYPAR